MWIEQVLMKQDARIHGGEAASGGHHPSASEQLAHWTEGKPCKAVTACLRQAVRELPGGRHDAALRRMTALTRLGEQGHEGVLTAIKALHGAFLISTEGEDRDAEGEWIRMVAGVDEVIEAEGLTPEKDKGCCGSAESRGKRKAADRLLELAEEVFTLGRTVDDRPFIVPKVGANVALFSSRARAALAEAFVTKYDTTVSDRPLKEAWTVLERRALSTDPVDLPVRVADYNSGTVIDLGTADGRCIVADADGWRLEARSPVVFRRPKPLLPLDQPVGGGRWEPIWQLTNISEGSRDLVRAWLVCALLRHIPHPILRIKGPQGAAKSTATKILSRVIDPSSGDATKPPTGADRWEMCVGSRWMAPVDNVSHIPEWWSDDLCRTVTGSGTVDRELYTDDDVVVKKLRAVVILNGITMPGEMRPDLLERTLSVDVARPKAYLSESEVEARVIAILPSVLGLVLDDLVAVLAHTGGQADVSDLRMNDFARVLARLDAARGTHALREYRATLDGLAADALESDPVSLALASFMRDKTEWTGTAKGLLDKLNCTLLGDQPEKWPKDATRLSQWLMRSTTTLLHAGITVVRLPRTPNGRLLRVRRAPAARVVNDADDAGSSYLDPLEQEEEEGEEGKEGYTRRNSASSASWSTANGWAEHSGRGIRECIKCKRRFVSAKGQAVCLGCTSTGVLTLD